MLEKLQLSVALVSAIGAGLMSSSAYVSNHARKSDVRKILMYLGGCSFVFASCSALSASMSLLSSHSSAPVIIRKISQTITWSSEVAAFSWTGVLGLYIAHTNRRKFPLRRCRDVVRCYAVLFWILELHIVFIYPSHSVIARSIWDLTGVLNLIIVVIALLVYSRRRHSSNSSVISRLRFYILAFIICIVPCIISDIFFYLGTPSKTLTRISDTWLHLLPVITSLIYFNACPCFKKAEDPSQPGNPAVLPPELKGLEIGAKIGQGIAVVYKGKWRGVQVAVKMQTLLGDEGDNGVSYYTECTAEIQREAKFMKALMHPNIVLFMEVGFYRGYLCIVSEYCSNGSLHDILSKSSPEEMPWPIKIRLALGIAQGLQYLHHSSVKMIHRDLKSPNIVVDESWHAKIADFGTLRFSEIMNATENEAHESKSHDVENTMHMTGLVGTTRWMAPEVITSEATRYNEKIDIYSFGVILWEMVTHRLPYEEIEWNTTIEEEIAAGNRLKFTREMRYPNGWKHIVQSCWNQKPETRPSSEEIIKHLQLLTYQQVYLPCGRVSGEEVDLQNIAYSKIMMQMTCEADCRKEYQSDDVEAEQNRRRWYSA